MNIIGILRQIFLSIVYLPVRGSIMITDAPEKQPRMNAGPLLES